MKNLLFAALLLFSAINVSAQRQWRVRTIPLDSIVMSDPCILADDATKMYYMTGTGGMLWKSPDLKMWTGPYRVTDTKSVKWMGERPEIWAAELHKYKGKYYYFATFTNNSIRIDSVRGNVIPRRASHILVSDRAEGPYRPVGDKDYLPANRPTLDGTFWVDKDPKKKNDKGIPYMVFCGEWLQNWNGTIEKIRLKDDLSAPVGKAKVLFRAYDSPWSREKDDDGAIHPNKVTDGPYLFRTQTGKLGMIWTSWVFDKYTQGVAYSKSGTLDGPWIQEPEPITPPNFGHGMLFRTFEGRLMMSVHSHEKINGRTHRVPHIFPVDDSGDKIKVRTGDEKYVFHLWPNGAPNTNEVTEPEIANENFVVNITDPVLTVYVPKHCNGLAVLAFPGGSYCQVWQGTEGHNMAEWYNKQGIVYAVLKYRLPNGGHKDVPMSDVHEAMRILKSHQIDYGFTQLGVQGCSAGGHLASTAATHYPSPELRPDFQILFYPVISFDADFTHFPTRESLIGRNAPQSLVDLYSNEKQVTADTPPAFIATSSDDSLVPVRNSVEYYNALVKHKVSVAMHLYPTGGHGWFGNANFTYRPTWQHDLSIWLNQLIAK